MKVDIQNISMVMFGQYQWIEGEIKLLASEEELDYYEVRISGDRLSEQPITAFDNRDEAENFFFLKMKEMTSGCSNSDVRSYIQRAPVYTEFKMQNNEENPWNAIYKLTKQILLDNSKFKDLHIRTMDPITFLFEYNTIRFGCGRQNGKTSWIIDNFDQNTLVILNPSNSHEIATLVYSRNQSNADFVFNAVIPTIYSVTELVTRTNTRFTKIIIDDASLIPKKKIREIIEFLFEKERINLNQKDKIELVLVG